MAKTEERFQPSTYRAEKLFLPSGAGALTYELPPFQRDYSWTEPRWRDLWRDIARKASSRSKAEHFLGVVLLQDVAGGTASKTSVRVIDGQQRLLTLACLLCALRDEGASLDVDPFSVSGKPRWKGLKPETELVVRELAQGAFVDAFPRAMQAHPLAQAYRYFRSQVRLGDPPGPELANALTRPAKSDEDWDEWPGPTKGNTPWDKKRLVAAVTRQLVVVAIHLPPEEQEATGVFESLNGANTPLLEFDKVRVLLYTRSGGETGDYSRLFLPAEKKLLGTSYRGKVKSVGDQFLYDYTLARAQDFWVSDSPSAQRTHEAIKEHALRVAPEARQFTPKVLRPMLAAVEAFPLAVSADEPLKAAVQSKQLSAAEAMSIRAIAGFSSGPPVPLVLRVLLQSKLSSAERLKRLRLIEGFLVRATLSRVRLSPLRSEFIRLLNDVDQDASTSDLRRALIDVMDRMRIPDDDALCDLAAYMPIYRGEGKVSTTGLSQLLRSIEHSKVTNVGNLLTTGSTRSHYTVEHLFPQSEKITKGWSQSFKDWGRSREDLQEAYELRHALGNLILLKRADNSGFGTKTFQEKRALLASSTEQLLMYKSVVHKQTWTAKQMMDRGRLMSRDLLKARPV